MGTKLERIAGLYVSADSRLYVSADSKDFLHETSKKFPKNPDKYLIFIMKSGIISIVEIK